MATLSRKQFLRACGSAAISACAAGLAAPPAGCTPVAGARSEGAASTPPSADGSSGTPDTEDFAPGYVRLHRTGELERRAKALWKLQETCRLCPRECGARRLKDERGVCGASAALEIAAFHPHFGEERPLVGRRGSGTVFFTHCNLRCVFCINWPISQGGEGRRRSIDELAGMMLNLQEQGCHNINIVTPTHYSPQLLLALDVAAGRGLTLPLVYNTSGWERLEILQALDGIVDVYLPDMKYASPDMADRYSPGAHSYPAVTRRAVLEMHRQVGVAKPAANGLMRRGLMIRHLVMPSGVGGTRDTLAWIAGNLPRDTYVNLMSQYRPAFRAGRYHAIARPVTRQEFDDVVQFARELGLANLDVQGGRWLVG